MTRIPVSHRSYLFPLAVLGAGCVAPAQPSAPPPSRVVASIESIARPLIVPDTVQAGVPFTAVVNTSSGACDTPSGAELRTLGNRADITPYDARPAGTVVCVLSIVLHQRAVAIAFPAPGRGVVALHAQRAAGLVTVLASVVVQP